MLQPTQPAAGESRRSRAAGHSRVTLPFRTAAFAW